LDAVGQKVALTTALAIMTISQLVAVRVVQFELKVAGADAVSITGVPVEKVAVHWFALDGRVRGR
jgi:hypothetical protein